MNEYEKLKKLLNSKDEESIVLGLKCIENLNFKEYIVEILLLLKYTHVSLDMWEREAGKTTQQINAVLGLMYNKYQQINYSILLGHLTSKSILSIAYKFCAPIHKMELALSEINQELLIQIEAHYSDLHFKKPMYNKCKVKTNIIKNES